MSPAVVGPEVSIRRAEAADEVALRAFWDAHDDEASHAPYPGTAFSPTLITKHIALVAEAAGKPIGCIYAVTPSDHYGFVFGLYVAPAARRRGIAERLLRQVAGELRTAGQQHIVLNVETPNHAARSLYEKLGFADAARTLRVEIERLSDGSLFDSADSQ